MFPVRGKRPTTPNGKDDASTDPDIINIFWRDDVPDVDKLGVAGVIPENIVVLDIDGDAGVDEIKKSKLHIPATLVAESGRGWHYWYRIPPGNKVSRRIKVLPSVDILVNGYVVLPPSPHPAGGEYKWSVPLDPKTVVEMPLWIGTIVQHEIATKNKVSPEKFFSGVTEGERQTSLFRYACALRARPKMSIVEAKVLLRGLAECCVPPWTEGTDDIADRVWGIYKEAEDRDEVEETEFHPKTLADLLAGGTFSKNEPLIEKLLPSTGYTLVTAAPKEGKSILAAQASACVATGTPFLGMKVKQSGVLYLDLEQDEQDAAVRWMAILRSLDISTYPSNLHTGFDCPPMDEGGLDAISNYLSQHPHISLVVVDTLADVWPADEGSNSNAYHREQRIVRKFLPLSRDFGCAFLIVHHDKKSDSAKMVGKASGTYAVTGKAKAVWNLDKYSEHSATLTVTGKNVPSSTTDLTFDEKGLVWRGLVKK